MPPIRDHDMAHEEVEEDDGMPPLVDNPNPSMTFTFFTDMRPITFSSTEPTNLEVLPETPTFSSPPASPTSPEDNPGPAPSSSRVSHGKKRDASYIPRPPNAFILFRSSFIKSQQVPGKVEGNHSTLSKIIGMYWRTLPREEREQWEARAVIAQAEHRKKYPDWRFRPGANAMAKLKVKDGPGTSRKRYNHNRKSKEADGEISMEQRCAKIADLLVEGLKGSELEAAVKEWEGDQMNQKEKSVGGKGSAESRDDPEREEPTTLEGRQEGNESRSPPGVSEIVQDGGKATRDRASAAKRPEDANDGDPAESDDSSKTRSRTPDSPHDGRFKVSLTSMFRRSLSAPASRTRPCSNIVPSPSATPAHMRRDTVSFPMTAGPVCQPPYGLPASPRQHEGAVRRDNVNDNLDCVLSSRPPPLTFVDGTSTRWNDLLSHHAPDVPMPFSSLSTPAGFSYNTASPASSSSAFQEIYTVQVPTNNSSLPRRGGERQREQTTDLGMTYSVYRYNPQAYSSYSTLKGWAGDDPSRMTSSEASGPSFTFPSSPTLEGTGNYADNWTDPPSTSSASSSAPSRVSPSSYRIDPTFGWYEHSNEGNRALGSMRDLEPYSVGLENTFDIGETANAPAGETDNDPDNYVYSFSNRRL